MLRLSPLLTLIMREIASLILTLSFRFEISKMDYLLNFLSSYPMHGINWNAHAVETKMNGLMYSKPLLDIRNRMYFASQVIQVKLDTV